MQLEEEFKRNFEFIHSQYLEQEKVYNDIVDLCQKYQSEKYNEQGFCEEGKFYGEIIDIQMKNHLEIAKDIEKAYGSKVKIVAAKTNESLKKEKKDEEELPADPEVRLFEKIPGQPWYANAVAWAAEVRAVNGTSDTTFSPELEMYSSREQSSSFCIMEHIIRNITD